jgi:hypothetical protein
MVWPSGGADRIVLAAITPTAPVRFSNITGTPSSDLNISPTARPTISVALPGAAPDTSLIGFPFGKVCAHPDSSGTSIEIHAIIKNVIQANIRRQTKD